MGGRGWFGIWGEVCGREIRSFSMLRMTGVRLSGVSCSDAD